MKISVLGCGRWGSFIAWYQATVLKNDVILYGEEGRQSFDILKRDGKNEYVALDKSITLVSDLGYALENSDYIIISISSQSLREFMEKVIEYPVQDKTFILCMKGLEVTTGKRLSQVMIESGISAERVAVWVGPGHIQSFIAGVPNCMVIDSKNEALAIRLCDAFKSPLIRFYYGCDLIGNEIGAAAKNVMGLAAGMLDGLGLSTLKGPLMARGAHEVSRLIGAEGGKALSAYGLCHLGDYETTLFSHYSNNRAYGEAFVKKQPFEKLAEGVATARAMRMLAKRDGVELPICEAVCRILFEGQDAKAVLLSLFERKSKAEF